jgi:hypothetical protein
MKKSKTTQYVHHAIRIFTGLFFLGVFTSKFEIGVSGLNNPDVFTPEGWAFITAIKEIRYLFPFIGIVGLISGLAILANRYVAIAAIIMIPITLNFELFHIFLGFPLDSAFHIIRHLPSIVIFASNLYMLYSERWRFAALLKP